MSIKRLLQKNRAEIQLCFIALPLLEDTFVVLHQSTPPLPYKNKLIDHYFSHHILKQLSIMLGRCVVLYLHQMKQQGFLRAPTSQERFQEFIRKIETADVQKAFWEKYPYLKKLISKILRYQQKNFISLLTDLDKDLNTLIEKKLLPPHTILTKIHFTSDNHSNNKQVAILDFLDNQQKKHRIVYKPRSADTDEALVIFLGWVNQHCHLHLKITGCLNLKTHSWFEYVDFNYCENQQQLSLFYEEYGSLLAVAYLLSLSDLHFENIIAHGQHPVIIDCETLLTPLLDDLFNEAATPFHFNVWHTGLLPMRIGVNQENKGIEVSALAQKKQISLYKKMVWEKAGTDEMHLARIATHIKPKKNYPRLKEQRLSIKKYINNIHAGFNKTFQIFITHKNYLLSDASVLNGFKGIMTRLVLRETQEYAKLWHESFHPNLCQNKKKRDTYWQWLAQRYRNKRNYAAIVTSEINALRQNDIPAFYAISDQNLLLPNKIPLIKQSGWDLLQKQLKNNITWENLGKQNQLMHLSFTTYFYSKNNRDNKKILSDTKQKQRAKQDVSTTWIKIADTQLQKLIEEKHVIDNITSWPYIQLIGKNPPQSVLQWTDWSLYSGKSGIMLSFFWGGKLLRQPIYQKQAQLLLQELHHSLIQQKKLLAVDNLSAFEGYGGILFAVCMQKAYFSKENLFLDEIISMLLSKINACIINSEHLDIISGCAGTLLILLQCKHLIRSPLTESLILLLAQKIIQHYNFSQATLGLAHGISGIAWAISIYAQHTADETAIRWLKDALKKEYSLWKTQKTTLGYSWCKGIVGLVQCVLARKECADHPYQTALIKTMRSYLNKPYVLTQRHSLCHGNLGMVDLVLGAFPEHLNTFLPKQKNFSFAKAIENTKYIRPLSKLAPVRKVEGGSERRTGVYTSAHEDMSTEPTHKFSTGIEFETRSIDDGLPAYATPGLLLGRAGLIYQALRLPYPEKIPSVLMLNPVSLLQKMFNQRK